MLRILMLWFTGFGIISFITIAIGTFRELNKPKHKKDNVYVLCERYINLCHNGDGYWKTDTEIGLHQALEERMKKMEFIE